MRIDININNSPAPDTPLVKLLPDSFAAVMMTMVLLFSGGFVAYVLLTHPAPVASSRENLRPIEIKLAGQSQELMLQVDRAEVKWHRQHGAYTSSWRHLGKLGVKLPSDIRAKVQLFTWEKNRGYAVTTSSLTKRKGKSAWKMSAMRLPDRETIYRCTSNPALVPHCRVRSGQGFAHQWH